jgi:acetyltransferase-like isoleucine patch superfamily enzyme
MRNEMNDFSNIKIVVNAFFWWFASILPFPPFLIWFIHKCRGVKFKNYKKVFFWYDVYLDWRRPDLIEIWEDVWLPRWVKILTHFHPPLWLVKYFWDMILKPTKIWNSVFIWMNSIILPWVNICNEVVIWAWSIVTKDIKTPWIYAWSPAKFIKEFNLYNKNTNDK